jgi:hypothetical protein
MRVLEACYEGVFWRTPFGRTQGFLSPEVIKPSMAMSCAGAAKWRLTSNAQTLIQPSLPVEATQPSESLLPSVVPGFPVPHVTEYTVRTCCSNTRTHSHSCSAMRFHIRTVQSSDADARYRPFGAHARDHTVDACPVSVAKQNQSSLGSSR